MKETTLEPTELQEGQTAIITHWVNQPDYVGNKLRLINGKLTMTDKNDLDTTNIDMRYPHHCRVQITTEIMNIKTEYGATLKALENRYPEHLNVQITEDQHLDEITVTRKCPINGLDYSVKAPWQYFFQWLIEYRFIQTVFREFTDNQREFLISGTTPAEWSKFIGDEEE